MRSEVHPAHVWSSLHESWEDGCSGARPDLHVGIVLWPDFTMIALSGFIDALRLAADIGDRGNQLRCRWTVMSLDGRPVRASCGLDVAPNAPLLAPAGFDYLVVASGLITGIEKASPRLEDYLRATARAGVNLVGLCTGGIVLARAGLLRDRRCCVASFHVGDLERFDTGAVPVFDRLFLDDGNRITCAGGVASVDLASYLVERHCGGGRASKLVDRLLADRSRAGSHAQSRTWLDLQKIKDHRVRRALVLMEQNLQAPLTIQQLAEKLNASERHVERIFRTAFNQSPSKIYRRLRLHLGKWLLSQTAQTVTQIAYECGFSDTSHFCRQFLDEFGVTPTKSRDLAPVAAPPAGPATRSNTACDDLEDDRDAPSLRAVRRSPTVAF